MNHAAALADALTRPLDAGELGVLADMAEEHAPERFEDVMRRWICAVPDDDGPRLRLADWWTAQGRAAKTELEQRSPKEFLERRPDGAWATPRLDELRQCAALVERGEFVRVQCELAKYKVARCPNRKRSKSLPDTLYGLPVIVDGSECGKCRWCILHRRETELLKGNNPWDWMGDAIRTATPDGLPWDDRVVFRRGFVESLTATAADWLQYADAILCREPVRRVRLTTMPKGDSFATRCHDAGVDFVANGGQVFSARGAAKIVLEKTWSGIEFELPRVTAQISHAAGMTFSPTVDWWAELPLPLDESGRS